MDRARAARRLFRGVLLVLATRRSARPLDDLVVDAGKESLELLDRVDDELARLFDRNFNNTMLTGELTNPPGRDAAACREFLLALAMSAGLCPGLGEGDAVSGSEVTTGHVEGKIACGLGGVPIRDRPTRPLRGKVGKGEGDQVALAQCFNS